MARLIRLTKPSQALAWLDSIESWEIHHSGAVDRPICKDPLLLHVPRLDPTQYKSSALDYGRREARVDRLEGVHQDVSGDKGWGLGGCVEGVDGGLGVGQSTPGHCHSTRSDPGLFSARSSLWERSAICSSRSIVRCSALAPLVVVLAVIYSTMAVLVVSFQDHEKSYLIF